MNAVQISWLPPAFIERRNSFARCSSTPWTRCDEPVHAHRGMVQATFARSWPGQASSKNDRRGLSNFASHDFEPVLGGRVLRYRKSTPRRVSCRRGRPRRRQVSVRNCEGRREHPYALPCSAREHVAHLPHIRLMHSRLSAAEALERTRSFSFFGFGTFCPPSFSREAKETFPHGYSALR